MRSGIATVFRSATRRSLKNLRTKLRGPTSYTYAVKRCQISQKFTKNFIFEFEIFVWLRRKLNFLLKRILVLELFGVVQNAWIIFEIFDINIFGEKFRTIFNGKQKYKVQSLKKISFLLLLTLIKLWTSLKVTQQHIHVCIRFVSFFLVLYTFPRNS